MATANTAAVTVDGPLDPAGGYVYYALADAATLPTDATSDVASSLVDLGLLDEDGLTITEELSSEDIVSWGGEKVRTLVSTRAESAEFGLLQASDYDVACFEYGSANVDYDADSGATTIRHTAVDTTYRAVVIDMLAAPNLRHRVVLPRATVKERGEQTFTGTAVSGRKVTLALDPDEDGATVYEYFGEVE